MMLTTIRNTVDSLDFRTRAAGSSGLGVADNRLDPEG